MLFLVLRPLPGLCPYTPWHHSKMRKKFLNLFGGLKEFLDFETTKTICSFNESYVDATLLNISMRSFEFSTVMKNTINTTKNNTKKKNTIKQFHIKAFYKIKHLMWAILKRSDQGLIIVLQLRVWFKCYRLSTTERKHWWIWNRFEKKFFSTLSVRSLLSNKNFIIRFRKLTSIGFSVWIPCALE